MTMTRIATEKGRDEVVRRFQFALVAAVLASGFVLTSALADASFSDPAGDANDAPDLTAVTVSNDTGGNITFHVAVTNFTPESDVVIWLDTDKNASTGDDGSEYELSLTHSADASNSGWDMGRWDGTKWVDTPHSTVVAASTATSVEFRVNKSELGGVSGFSFQVWTHRYTADAVTARDYAPDGTLSSWTYDLTAPKPTPTPAPVLVKPVFGAVKSVPAGPVAGKQFSYAIQVTASDSGSRLTKGTMVCVVSIGSKVLASTQAFKQGVAGVTFLVPKSARGKQLTITMRMVLGNQSTTKVVTYKVH